MVRLDVATWNATLVPQLASAYRLSEAFARLYSCNCGGKTPNLGVVVCGVLMLVWECRCTCCVVSSAEQSSTAAVATNRQPQPEPESQAKDYRDDEAAD